MKSRLLSPEPVDEPSVASTGHAPADTPSRHRRDADRGAVGVDARSDAATGIPASGDLAAIASDLSESPNEQEAAASPSWPTNISNLGTTPEPEAARRTSPTTSRRPQGRPIIAALLFVGLVASVAKLVFAFMPSAPQGIVVGKVVGVEGPWEGLIIDVAVHQGDRVRAGDALTWIENPESDDQLARLEDQLKGAIAALKSEEASLVAASLRQRENAAAAQVTVHNLEGELAIQRGRLAELTGKLDRRRALAAQKIVVAEEMESLRFSAAALQEKIEHLQQGLKAAQGQWAAASAPSQDELRLDPHRTQIALLRAEIERLREHNSRGLVRAPIDGVVVSVDVHAGERARPGRVLVEILERESLEMAMYVSLDERPRFAVGSRVEVLVAPSPDPMVCEVTRIGSRMEPLPYSIRSAHLPNETRLPVYLRPCALDPDASGPSLGATVQMLRMLEEPNL